MRSLDGPGIPPLDRILFASDLLRIGSFRADVDHPRFRDSGPIQNHIFVFPRTSVVIQHDGRPAFTTDTRLVTYYNRGQLYERRQVDPRGDRCEWFALRDDALLAAIREHDPGALARPCRPFRFSHGPSDERSYLLQRLVVRHLTESSDSDVLAVEELVMHVLGRILRLAYRPEGARDPVRPATRVSGTDRTRVRLARDLLARRFCEPLSLHEIAAHAGASVFHLCRVFRRISGTTIHRHRNALRLRRSLELVVAPDSDLTRVALELGYSSHSHFTTSFRRAFATTPSRFRRRASSGRIRALAANLVPHLPARR